jgi:membrane fusion protein
MAERPLFRSESESARASAWLGRILLIRPLSFTFLTIVAAFFALSLATFFVFGEYTRKSRVAGVLAPTQGVLRIIAPQGGKVVAAYVREGDAVEAEAPLFVIADTRATRGAEEVSESVAVRIEARREALQRQRAHILAALESEQTALIQRSAGISREIDQLDAEIAAQESRVSLSDYGLERAKRLEGVGFLSRAARDREEQAKLEQVSRVEALRRTRLALSREFAAVEHEIGTARSRAHAQLAALDQQRASIDQEHVERDAQFHATLVAPISGTMGAILVDPGQTITAGMTLATVIPAEATLEAHLFTPSRSIGFVRDGQEVLLRFLAYPYQKFGSHRAQVVAISRNPLPPGEMGFTPADGSREPLYRIKASLDSQTVIAYGKPQALQAGMQVEADIRLDRRRLIEWIFEPLLSLSGRA